MILADTGGERSSPTVGKAYLIDFESRDLLGRLSFSQLTFGNFCRWSWYHGTVRNRRIETGISEASKRVSIFNKATSLNHRSRGALEGIDPGTPVTGWSEDEVCSESSLLYYGGTKTNGKSFQKLVD